MKTRPAQCRRSRRKNRVPLRRSLSRSPLPHPQTPLSNKQ